jgi:O-antigen/teichoic acid export membrane protein
MARGTLAQQGAQAATLLAALIITTLLARRLELEEFGLYGLVVSFLGYIAFAISSAEAAAVRSIAALPEGRERNQVFTAALLVYAVLGVAAGLVLAAGGAVLVGLLGFSEGLVHSGREASVAVGVVTAVGWPLKAFHAVLRADQRFGTASATEALGQVLLTVSVVAVLTVDGPLWLLIAVGSSVPLFMGICALPAVVVGPSVVGLAPRGIRREDLRKLATASFGMFGVGAADVVVTSLDRVILGVFRPAASLGLYEGAIRPNNVIRSATSAFSVTLLPVLSRLESTQGGALQRALVLRGTRYMLAAVAPPTAALIVLSEPVLTTWLGERFADSWVACAIFLAWWLVASNASIAETTMFVDGKLSRMVRLSWSVALINLVLSLALAPLLGLEGVALGTTLAYMVVLPFWVRYMLRRFDLGVGELARAAWLPAYSAAALAAGLALLARLTMPLDSAPVVLAVLAVAVASGWAVVFLGFFTSDERRLAREVVGR